MNDKMIRIVRNHKTLVTIIANTVATERGHIALTHNDKNNRANVQTDTNQRQGCDTASCTAASTNKNIGYIVVNFLNWAT